MHPASTLRPVALAWHIGECGENTLLCRLGESWVEDMAPLLAEMTEMLNPLPYCGSRWQHLELDIGHHRFGG